MFKRIRDRQAARGAAVRLCEACSSVCDQRCRARGLREAQRTRAAMAKAGW
jgi:hypothetical protein